MRLIEALRYTQPTSIAFVGAGGKTTALFRTAKEIVDSRGEARHTTTVFVTTTTHLGAWQTNLVDHLIIANSIRDIEKLRVEIPAGVVLITGEVHDHLLSGLSGVLLEELQRIAEEQEMSLLIEADGAHQCPLKAPAEHEPAIPDFTRRVFVVAGMTGLGKPLTKDWVHRPELFARLSGLHIGEEITEEAIIKMIIDQHGGLKGIPPGARRTALLNQADDAELQSRARSIGKRLIPVYQASVVASLLPPFRAIPPGHEDGRSDETEVVIEPIAGIVLAAGGSSRFGTPKQLLPWNGISLVRHVVLTGLKAGLDPVVVVVGSSASEVRQSVYNLPVRIVNNPDWDDGMSSSIKAGLGGLSDDVGGAVFLQCDQPQIPYTLIRKLVEVHETTLHPIIAPQVDELRGNPVLFDAITFSELLKLTGDIGGRALFADHPVEWVTWHDPNILLDIDTPEDYTKFLELYPQKEIDP